MESVTNSPPLIVILGQTGSGKSALAMHLAQRFGGEIIAADSRTVYRGLDIGTAKPTQEDRELIRHHLIDVVDPNSPFTVADFQKLAFAAIADIRARGKVPFLVGGSGLYIDAVIYNFSFRKLGGNTEDRLRFQRMTTQELQHEIERRGLSLPKNSQNPRHLIRILETGGEPARRSSLLPNTLVIGLEKNKNALAKNLAHRVDQMVEHGLLEEITTLIQKYGAALPIFATPQYRPFASFLDERLSLEEAKQQVVQNDLQYARRQKTWFKRNPDIQWISKMEEAIDLITTQLNN